MFREFLGKKLLANIDFYPYVEERGQVSEKV